MARLVAREQVRTVRRKKWRHEQSADANQAFSRRDFYELHPINKQRQWLTNRVVARRIAPAFADLLGDGLCVISRAAENREGVSIVRLRKFPNALDANIDGLIEAIRQRGDVRIVPLRWDRGIGVKLTYDGSSISLNDRGVSRSELVSALNDLTSRTRCIVVAGLERASILPDRTEHDLVMRFYVGRRSGNARVLDAELLAGDRTRRAEDSGRESLVQRGAYFRRVPFFTPELAHGRFSVRVRVDERTGAIAGTGREIPDYRAIVRRIEKVLSRPDSRFTFISVDVTLGRDRNFQVVDIASRPIYPDGRPFSQRAQRFLIKLSKRTQEDRRKRADAASVRRRVLHQVDRMRRRLGIFHLRSAGFTGPAAAQWYAMRRGDVANGTFEPQQIRRAHAWGFEAGTVERFGIKDDNRASFLARRDYLYAQPLNGKYAKWIRDRVSALMVFHPFEHLFAPTHFQVYRRDRGVHLVPISQEANATGASLDALAQVLQQRGECVLMPAQWSGRARARVAHDGETFFVNGVACTPGELFELLAIYSRRRSMVIAEPRRVSARQTRYLRVTMLNAVGDNPTPVEVLLQLPVTLGEGDDAERVMLFARVDPETGQYTEARRSVGPKIEVYDEYPGSNAPVAGEIENWPIILQSLKEMGRFAPQLRCMQYTIAISDGEMQIRKIAEKPLLSSVYPVSAELREFVQEQAREKHRTSAGFSARTARGLHNAKLIIRRQFAEALYPKGLLPYQSVRWLGDIRRDFVQRNGVPVKTKFWAYKNGFLSYRIPQYRITPANRLNFISDFEYRWLRHINTRYKYWLEDKISIKHVAADFNQFLPAYYYVTSPSGSGTHLVPMMDCPEGYTAEFTDVLRLAREKGVLALKPDEGSHGDGFFRLAFEGGQYTLNGEIAAEDDVLAILRDPANRYLVTEFIMMHPVLAEVYPQSVNTLRMTVFKMDAVTPQLGNAYLRVGSAASGFVDNTAAGGLLAEVDIATGKFGNAKSLVNGRVVATPSHPDTGVLIDGVIPHWEFVKEQVLKMAASFSQLEYLGFDVAITEDSFKIPEINRFPDFPRIDVLEPETIKYLLMKLDEKKRHYGYHRRRPRTLISLPLRVGQ
ncbi:sugar-transfer associated ATP-grasp domain-containing protein [Microbacterium halophytorum]|uniref:sugar-transfer associated ATP-grasp domain-containing protein n=1 Tax=Microbacterium halophytorum TaxID=2067568 RepID=UPI000CFC4106|nr:sugar-transfer associated ATP-grasp domain-containing protein [Microbacterium halophytorum]